MSTLLSLALAAFVALACGGGPTGPAFSTDAFAAVAPRHDSVPSFGDSPTYGPQLGICVTLASDERIDGDPALAEGAFRHVRYFQMMEKDYGDTGTPAEGGPEPCTNYDNPWACPERSLR